MKKQRGATVVGMIIVAGLVVAVAILAAKLVPSYLEFMAVKKILNSMGTSGDLKTMTPKGIQDSFFKRADIDNVHSVKPEDVTVAREGNQSAISVEYSVKVPIVANVSVCIDFTTSTSAQSE